MLYKLPSSQSPVYRKAKDILSLTQSIFEYLRQDLASLKKDGKENPGIYFTGDMLQQSVNLFPEIINAERKTYLSEKERHAASVKDLTNRIYKSCIRLEKSLSKDGKDFIGLLRSELKRFLKLQKCWRLTLR